MVACPYSRPEEPLATRWRRSEDASTYLEPVRAVEADDEVYIMTNFKGRPESGLRLPTGTIPASGNTSDMPFADYFRVRGGMMAQHN